MPQKPKLLTLDQLVALDWFPLSKRALYRVIKSGQLKARKLSALPGTRGTPWYVDEKDAIAFLNQK